MTSTAPLAAIAHIALLNFSLGQDLFSFSNSQTVHFYPRTPHRWHCYDFLLPPYPYDAAEIRTHISRVTLTQDILEDALPTELPRRGFGQDLTVTQDQS